MYKIAINGYGNLVRKEIELFSIEIAPAHLASTSAFAYGN